MVSGRGFWSLVCIAAVGACGRPGEDNTQRSQDAVVGVASRTSWTTVGAVAPVNGVAGGVLPTVKVAIADTSNLLVTSPNFTVTLSISGNAAPLGGTTSVTSIGGYATFSNLVINKSGSYRLIATGAGLATTALTVPFTVAPSAADHLEFTVQPSNVSAGVAISPAVQVSVLDAYDNAVNTAQTVVVSALNNPGGSTLAPTTVNTTTGRANYAALKLNRPGVAYTLQATCGSLSPISSAAFDVALGAATKLVVVSGGGQSVNVAAAAPFPLVAESQDLSGNVVAGVPVTWVAITGGGTPTPASVITNASGRTQTNVTMGTVAGTQRYEAQSAGLTSAVFNLTGKALTATQLLVASGDAQTGIAGTPLGASLVVKAADQYGNGVVNQTVTFAAASGGGSVSVASMKTLATGLAQFDATLGALAGPNSFTATKAGLTGSPVLFTATAVAGAVAQLSFAGVPASIVVATTLPPITVHAADANGNPVSGANVTLSLAGGTSGALLSGTAAQTTAAGDATFTDLAVNLLGAGYTLVASVGATSAPSPGFSVTCAVGLTGCGQQCLDTSTDTANCGTCGNACGGTGATGMTCVAGTCLVTQCLAGVGDCDANAANGCETILATSARNCGACGRSCAAGLVCVQGMCGSDDVVASFTAPASPWSYGAIPSNGTTGFTRFASPSTDSYGNQVWNNGSAGEPTVLFNGTPAATGTPYGGNLGTQSVALVPGNSDSAVLRYTAQAAGRYRLHVNFAGLVATQANLSFSETRNAQVQYCTNCGGGLPPNPVPHYPNYYCGFCGSTTRHENHTQSTTQSVAIVATPLVQVRVNAQSAWGPSQLNDQTRSGSFKFAWDSNWNYSPGIATQNYWSATGENEQTGALTLDLNPGDVVDFVVSAGRAAHSQAAANAYDLTQVTARFELACASGFADCDGDPANGCEVELAMQGGSCDRQSVAHSTGGLESENSSTEFDLSGDSRFVVFVDDAANLASGVSGRQVFLRDTQTGVTTLVSRAPNGVLGNGSSMSPSITPDGRWVAFLSEATNLASSPPTGVRSVYIFDRVTGSLERADVDENGVGSNGDVDGSPSVSDDGRLVAFTSRATNFDPAHPKSSGNLDAFIKDRASGTITRVMAPLGAEPAGSTYVSGLSGDGTTLVFHSDAANYVGSDSNGRWDVFALDLPTGVITLVSTGAGGQANWDSWAAPGCASRDGRRIVFSSGATNLGAGTPLGVTHVYAVSRDSGAPLAIAPSPYNPSLSADGRWVAVTTTYSLTPDDTNGRYDAYAYDLLANSWARLSVEAATGQTSADVIQARVASTGRQAVFGGTGRVFSRATGSTNYHPFLSAIIRPAEVSATRFPSSAVAGTDFSVDAALLDERGNGVLLSGLPVTLSLTSGPAGATFAPMTSPTVRGASHFPLNVPVAGSYTFTLSAPGFASRTVGPIAVTSGVAAAINIVSGDAQTSTVASTLAPFVVRVVDALGNPIAGRQIDWSVAQGTGSISPATTLTDAAGEATGTATLSTVAGLNGFVATSGTFTVAFSAVGVADAPASLAWTVQPSSTTAGVIMTPVPVVALLDAYGNPVDNLSDSVSVRWPHADTDFFGRTPSIQGTTTVAFSGGYAALTGLYANEVYLDSVLATSGALAQLSDVIEIFAGPPSAVESSVSASPSTQEGNGTATVTLTLVARDAFRNTVTGALATFAVSGTGNTVSTPSSTDGNGVSTAQLSSTRAEVKTVTATLNGTPLTTSANVTFTPLSSCTGGTGDCNGDSTDGCEVDLQTTSGNCGTCGQACASGDVCFSGACVASQYTLSGSAAGVTGTGLTLQNNLGDDLAITADGPFAFATQVTNGTTYSVTVKTQPTGQTCRVTSGEGMVAALPVSIVSVICTTHWKMVSTGVEHTLGVKTDGTLWAWGYNTYAQLGDGTNTQRLAPVQIGTGFSAVSAGAYHSLALKTDGTLWSWGYNSVGQLGIGGTTTQGAPVFVGGDFTSVSGGFHFSLAVKSDGTLWAWGFNGNGQLGDGSTNNQLAPVQVASGFASVAAGQYHAVAVKADGTLWTWGDNSFGQLGDGTLVSQSSPVQVGAGFASAVGGSQHTVALKTDGTVLSWGANTYGQVGDGTNIDSPLPVQVASGFASISANMFHALGVKTDGTLSAWGHNGYGQLGDWTSTDRNSPEQIGFASVTSGGLHSLALTPAGELWAWGYNYYGQVGDGTTGNRSRPVRVGAEFTSIAGGVLHSLGVKTDGTLWAWGANSSGQLGDGTQANRASPTQIGAGFASIAAGNDSSLAVKTDGTLWAWGSNFYGQLGDGTLVDKHAPVQIGVGFRSVASGFWHSLALKADGSLWAWGYNVYGQVGDGTATNQLTPVKIGTGFASVSGGAYHTVALKPDGTVWTWGYNGLGQLGDGTTVNHPSPILVGAGYCSISADVHSVIARGCDSALWAWGYNFVGQLGDGSHTNRFVPVNVGSGFASVDMGYLDTFGIKIDGTVWAWGYNVYGQAGDGTTANRSTPTQVP